MKDNKLIAEFMGVPQGEHTHFMVEPFALESSANVDDLKYDISWDWLVPVVVECFNRFANTDTIDHMRLNDALLTCNIKELYEAVVEFIKEHNKYICGSCGDHVNEVVFNEDADVDECTNCTEYYER